MVVLTMPEKIILEQAYLELGGTPFNKNCKSCIIETFQRTVNVLDKKNQPSTVGENYSGVKTIALTNRIKSEKFFKADESMTNTQLLHILKKAKQPEPRNASKKNLIDAINSLKLPLNFK
jgi:hypothetical protein